MNNILDQESWNGHVSTLYKFNLKDDRLRGSNAQHSFDFKPAFGGQNQFLTKLSVAFINRLHVVMEVPACDML